MRIVNFKYIELYAFLLCLLMISLAIIGGVNNYSSVPFWDMWDGYLDFYAKIMDGDYSSLWAQHNEHRIFLARSLFFLDLHFFEGRGAFLIVVNYILVLISFVVFYKYLMEVYDGEKREANVFAFVILAWLFSWCQHENLTWGFQSQFFLAQLLPLMAFFFQYKSTKNDRFIDLYFGFSLLLGMLSVGSMANGILTLPLMVIFSLVLSQSWKRSLLLMVVSALSIFLYFNEYNKPAHHSSTFTTFLNNPLEVFEYVLLYVGGPFYYLLGAGSVGKIVAILSGLFLVFSSAWLFFLEIFKKNKSPLRISLLFFILYIGGTALGTASGRVLFGIDQALSSRYMTPSLMAWVSIFILLTPTFKYRLGIMFSVSLITVMVPYQIKANQLNDVVFFERLVSSLAVELKIHDEEQIKNIYPFTRDLIDRSDVYVSNDWSVFGYEPIKDGREKIGLSIIEPPKHGCVVQLDNVMPIKNVNDYVRITGWFVERENKDNPKMVNFASESGVVVGLALVKKSNSELNKKVALTDDYSYFKGYIQKKYLGDMVYIVGGSMKCLIDIEGKYLFSVLGFDGISDSDEVNVKKSDIVNRGEWLGSDSWNSKIQGMEVIGSWLDSDANTGAVELALNRGDKILYRSGPTEGRQIVELSFNNDERRKFLLPVATDWVVLSFDSESLPDKFRAIFIDNGHEWGEWSAISIKNVFSN